MLERTGAEIARRNRRQGHDRSRAISPRAAGPRRPRSRPAPQPDILLNNADGPLPGDFRDWSRDDWIAALDTMMLSPIEMMRLTVDGMMARGFGRIVNIVSRSVKIPQLELGLSNGARSGLVGFVGGLARQTVARNVTINNLLPGIFDSDAQRAHIRRHAGRQTGKIVRRDLARARARPIRPSATAGRRSSAPIAPSCARTHAGFITGQNLLIDGGSYPGTYLMTRCSKGSSDETS